MLPILLEETPRPGKKNLKMFYDHLHRLRCFLFCQWKSTVKMEISDEHLGQSVDRLIGLVLLLEHCKRYGYFDLTLSQFTDVWKDGTLNTLQRHPFFGRSLSKAIHSGLDSRFPGRSF